MVFDLEPEDKTGEKITSVNHQLVTEVIARTSKTNIYVCQDFVKVDPVKRSAFYFMSQSAIDAMQYMFLHGHLPEPKI